MHVLSFFVKLPIATMVVSRKSPAFAITPTESPIASASTTTHTRRQHWRSQNGGCSGAVHGLAASRQKCWGFSSSQWGLKSSNEATDLFLGQMDPKLKWICLSLYKQDRVLGCKWMYSKTTDFLSSMVHRHSFQINFRWFIFTSHIQKNWRQVSLYSSYQLMTPM